MSDSRILNVDSDERGLIAAVVQDAETNDVVALCYLDNQALAETLQTGGCEKLAARLPAIGDQSWRLVDVRSNLDGHSLTVLVERYGRLLESQQVSLLTAAA